MQSNTSKAFKLAVLQTRCVADKGANIKYISEALHTAGKNGAKISVLGEVCNSPYTRDYMVKFAQDFNDSQTLKAIKQACLSNKMYAIGTIPRIQKSEEKNKYFNTAFVINPEGKMHAQMDKIHLFDIDIPGKITYKQSDTFEQGSQICVFDTEYCKIGLGICYDIRFPELALVMANKKGAKLLIYPGSFNQTTGPLHWEILLRGRAVDCQCYTVGVSCAQYKQDPSLYQAWGHSSVVDPYGKIIVGLDENPGIGYCEIDTDVADQFRKNVPTLNQKRYDLYTLDEVK